MQFINSQDGTPIAVWQAGTGQPLLLIHGTSGDHTTWSPVIDQLAQQFRVYSMDRRGRGQSGDAAQYSLQQEADDIAAVCAAIGDKVHIAAHSFGGLCALQAAPHLPQLGGLIVYEPPLSLQGSAWSATFKANMQRALDVGDNEAVLLLFYRELLKTPEAEMTAMQQGANWSARVAEAHTIVRELQSIESYQFDAEHFREFFAPTLLLLGSDSHPRRHDIAQTLHQHLPNSRIALLAGQQHSAIRSAPDLFVQVVREFLQGF